MTSMIETTQTWEFGDCLKLHPSIPDKSVDLIFTDLPYGQTKNNWDKIISPDKLWDNYYNRIIKKGGVILLFGQGIFTAKMILSNEEMYQYSYVWDKILTTGHLNATHRPLRDHEDIMVFYEGTPIFNPQTTVGKKNHSKKPRQNFKNNTYGTYTEMDTSKTRGRIKHPKTILRFQKPHPSVAIHPNQKPVKLIEHLIKTYTNEGGVVHDSCIGSGSILEGCQNTNRNCIGFELTNEWEYNYNNIIRSKDCKLNQFKVKKV